MSSELDVTVVMNFKIEIQRWCI